MSTTRIIDEQRDSGEKRREVLPVKKHTAVSSSMDALNH